MIKTEHQLQSVGSESVTCTKFDTMCQSNVFQEGKSNVGDNLKIQQSSGVNLASLFAW